MAENPSTGTVNIDPNSFTPDELLKHIYRKLEEMNSKMEQREKDYVDFKKHQDDRIDQNKGAIIEIRAIIREKDQSFKTTMVIVSTGVTIISLIIGVMGYMIR